jgi:integrase
MFESAKQNIIMFPTFKGETVGQVVEEFERDYFVRRARTPKSESTWKETYWTVLKTLPQEEPLTADLLLSIIKNIPPDTHKRKQSCMVLTCLAKFAGIPVNLSYYAGTYSFIKTSPRLLPSDEKIIDAWRGIDNPNWSWAFGMIAAYGLRPHEVFLIDSNRLASGKICLHILEGKTGSRIVYPFRPEWFSDFRLQDVLMPKCTGKNNKDLGNRVAHAFKRHEIPFRAYDLRHAWAVRSMEFGLDISLAAQQMGHSIVIHSKVYHQWLSERVHERAYQALLIKHSLA